MATTQQITLQDFLELSSIEESPAWELVDGQANQKLMPTAHHSILQKRLTAAIDQANSLYEAFPELRCVSSSNSVVPDITVIHQDRIPSGNIPIAGAPDWIIEILSPDQSTTKLMAKIQQKTRWRYRVVLSILETAFQTIRLGLPVLVFAVSE